MQSVADLAEALLNCAGIRFKNHAPLFLFGVDFRILDIAEKFPVLNCLLISGDTIWSKKNLLILSISLKGCFL